MNRDVPLGRDGLQGSIWLVDEVLVPDPPTRRFPLSQQHAILRNSVDDRAGVALLVHAPRYFKNDGDLAREVIGNDIGSVLRAKHRDEQKRSSHAQEAQHDTVDESRSSPAWSLKCGCQANSREQRASCET